MKEVLEYIENKKQYFATLPLFEYMQDTSIYPQQRLAWAPYITPLLMGFGDLWKYVLRREPTTDKVQEIINKHTYEDENHWKWLPKDIKALGFCQSLNFSDSLVFLWSEETTKARLLCLQITMLTCNVESRVLLAAIEAIEAIANVVFSRTAPVANELKEITSKNYLYFGNLHLVEDSTHSIFETEKEDGIESIKLTEKQKNQCFELIDNIFELFTECFNTIMEKTLESTQTSNVNISSDAAKTKLSVVRVNAAS